MQPLSFSLALFVAAFGISSFAALYARNVGPVFGLTFERLANPVFSFGAMLAVLLIASSSIFPLVPTLFILTAVSGLLLALRMTHKQEKYKKILDLTFQIFFGSSILINMLTSPAVGTFLGTMIPMLFAVLTAIHIGLISLRPEKNTGTAA